RAVGRKQSFFLGDVAAWRLSARAPVPTGPTHVFFLFVDHFEPGHDTERLRRWAAGYRALAARHRDSTGRPLQHTWFYPGEQFKPANLKVLAALVADGLGEVELHYHHRTDTDQSLHDGLLAAIIRFQRFGFLVSADGATHFAFVHGNSSLDDSDGPDECGVTTELRLLRDLGSFADFTFPALFHDSQ